MYNIICHESKLRLWVASDVIVSLWVMWDAEQLSTETEIWDVRMWVSVSVSEGQIYVADHVNQQSGWCWLNLIDEPTAHSL